MKRVYRHYLDWEDFECGMWSRVGNEVEIDMLQKAIEFTRNHELYGAAMMEVITKWPNTMEHNLTNASINRLAFIGHCAVSFKLGIPEYLTRKAWRELTDLQRHMADEEAKKALAAWKFKYTNKLCELL